MGGASTGASGPHRGANPSERGGKHRDVSRWNVEMHVNRGVSRRNVEVHVKGASVDGM
jgi:hypothetical protein